MIAGIVMTSWYGYQFWSSVQSVENVDGHVVKALDHDSSENISYKDEPEVFEQIFHQSQLDLIDYHDGDEIAKLIIPAVDLAFDVFWGTGDEALAKGVGMYESEWTAPPDHGRHTVLSGHRDSVFRPVGDLQEGDSIYVNYQGEDYEYQINKTWITDADDHSVIVDKEEPTLTLSTCYPFQFIGSAPDRYIVQAELIRKGDLLNMN